MSAQIRVATLNIWGPYGDWPSRRKVLRAGFDELDPDLVVLQETVVGDGIDQARELFGDEYFVLHQGRRAREGVGCSIVSRWPAEAVEEVDLLVTDRVDPDDFVGRATLAEYETPVGRVLVAHHKPNWQITYERERELQALATARRIEERVAGRDGVHVVLAGDFDTRPETSSIRFLTGRKSLGELSVHYQDVWELTHPGEPGHTFTVENPMIVAYADWSRIPPRRIDYVMVRCDERGPTLRIASAQQIFNRPVDGVYGSDHYGVAAELVSLES